MSHVCSHACPQHLYADALHSIFALLSLADTAAALATCKHWLDACRSDRKGRGLTLSLSIPRLRCLSQSFLRRHVSCIVSNRSVWPWSYGPSELALLSQLPNLTSATLCIDIAALAPPLLPLKRSAQTVADRFPSTLLQLSIGSSDNGKLALKQALLCSIARVQSLTSLSLAIGLESLQLAPLLALPHLRCLHTESIVYDAANVSTLLQLPALERLTLCLVWNHPPFIDDLCARPGALSRLRHLELITPDQTFAFTAETVRLLAAACPALETLRPTRLEPAAMPELCTFTGLRTLWVCTAAGYLVLAPLAAHVQAIVRCRGLTHLTLCDYIIAEADLRLLADGLPDLRALALSHCSVMSLAPLRPLSHLSSISVLESGTFSLGRLSTLLPMPQLRSIHIQLRGNKFRSERTIRKRFPDVVDVRVV